MNYETKFNTRLKKLVETLRMTDFPIAPPYGSLIYLKKILTQEKGHLYGLEVKIQPTLEGNGNMYYDLNDTTKTLKLDYKLIASFEKVCNSIGTCCANLNWTIDCFLIHEFLHFAQGMSEGRHSGLRTQSPDTLLAIDYQADALSAIAITVLAWIKPENYFTTEEINSASNNPHILWKLYMLSIVSILNQMEVFTHLWSDDLDRKKVSEESFPLTKIKRIVLWHYQFHRSVKFNKKRSLADFQILSQPRFHFRNLESVWAYNKKYLNKSWPINEEEFINKTPQCTDNYGFTVDERKDPLCILSTTSQYGTTRFVRINTDDNTIPGVHITIDSYKSAFIGFFENSLEDSKVFFETIFDKEKWLTGKGTDGDDSGPGNFGNPDPDDPVSGPGGFGVGLHEDEKIEVLSKYLTPTMFPLTIMETETRL